MTRYIAIDGRGGSGKTELSQQIADQLQAPIVHLDEFGDDFHPFIGIPKLINALKDLDDEIIIFEGVGVFDDRIPYTPVFRILVDTPPAVSFVRGKTRDEAKGRALHMNTDWDRVWEIWEKAENQYFTQETREKADYITGADWRAEITTINEKIQNFIYQ